MNTIRNEVPNEVTSTFNTAGPPGGIPRMRTVQKIVEEIRALDPETDVSEYWVRQITKSGAVPVVWAGKKALINLDSVLDLLRAGVARQKKELSAVPLPGIRKIDE